MRGCEHAGIPRLHTRMLPSEGRDCKFPISRSVRHFIPALVLPEGRFWAQQPLTPPSGTALHTQCRGQSQDGGPEPLHRREDGALLNTHPPSRPWSSLSQKQTLAAFVADTWEAGTRPHRLSCVCAFMAWLWRQHRGQCWCRPASAIKAILSPALCSRRCRFYSN